MPPEHTDDGPTGPYDAGRDPDGRSPAAGPGPADPVRALAGVLRAAGLDPSPEELADALWLAAARARQEARPAPPDAGPGPAPRRARAGAASGRPADRSAAREAGEPPPGPVREEGGQPEDPVTLYPAAGRAAGASDAEVPVAAGVPVRVPGAAALPRILDIQRALRALQRHRPPGRPTRTVLDEGATAEASARALGLVLPVFRPESRREATVRLVMDASPSMAVWQDMFDELRAVCERLGAFRDVQVHYLHRLPDGTAAVGRGPSPGSGVRSGDQLRDPTGRALTMLVSDCAGQVWREGEAQRLLHRWAGCAPCVVVQPLPQRLWARSWLPTERGVLDRAPGGGPGAGGPGAQGSGGGPGLRFRPDRPTRPGRPTGGLTVPVLPPNATALGAWARLVAGLGSGPVPAEVGRVLARHPAAPVPLPRAARPPHELVRRFRSSAAPGAVQLAVYLSAAPLTLPVMRLVQRTMLPDSEPSDLAEVLLSGLLRRSGAGPGPWYEFVPGVQDVLLGPLGRDEAALVLKHCSEYVLAHFGRGVRNFPALAVSQLTGEPVPAGQPGEPEPGEEGEPAPAGPLPQAFAQVSAKVVRRYLPGPPEEDPEPEPAPAPRPPGRAASVRAARERLLLGDADGDARHLHDAAALLRRAVTVPAGPDDPPEEAETELAGVLLRLWAVQRDPELLDEAERAVTGLRTARGWAALGRVLYERALVSVPGPGAEPLLAAAAREFASAGAAAGEAGLRVDCAVRRARALLRLAELRADPGPLHEALATLEPLAATDLDALLSLGEVLLALLPLTTDPAPLAERAAATLETALTLLEAPPLPDPAPPAPADPATRTGVADPATPTGPAGPAPQAAPAAPDSPGDGAAPAAPSEGPSDGAGPAEGPSGAVGPDPVVPPPADGPAARGGAAGAHEPAEAPGGAGPRAGAPEGSGTPAEGSDRGSGARPAGPAGGPGVPDGPAASDRPTGSGAGPAGPGRGAPRGRRWGRRVVGVRVQLAGALRYLPARLEEARGQLLRALDEAVGEPELRLAALLCLARVHRARYARDGDPVALEEAAEAYGRARRLIPRDGDAYAELLPEWGDVLLERARAADGRRFASTAVRVLRESRSAVAQSDPGAAYRLLRLASGLRLRHTYEGDLVDLREAEYLLELAVRQSPSALERARAWRDHGDVQQEIHVHTHTTDRLDRAADSYRRAWRAALEAGPDDTGAALRLAARVQELRGGVLEHLARPRAALDAYRAALELWQRQGLPEGERSGVVRARIDALESGG
ncbi:SAV_2336 N-terminal domain-related protein [Streptomyces sp. NPDC006662]|uniref:SAV_2336 N-terminal domain-related protein n=1 Tax=Streptomyces sp. NPDC006662 TaxID=3156902 RepID=UPI0033D65D84